VVVLDAQAVVAFLIDEPAADEVAMILGDRDDVPAIASIGLAEVIDVLVRVRGRTHAEVSEKVDWLRAGGLVVEPADEAIGREAGRLRALHYSRRDRPVSLADCVTLATALVHGAVLATSDPALATVARLEGLPLRPLPDSRGRAPG
jgi:predicted nucleic acid-binding protein